MKTALYILIPLAIVLGIAYWQKDRIMNLFNPDNQTPDESKTDDKKNIGSNFPLKKGSRGINVKKIQEAIIKKFGKNFLPKYGADGIFGDETEKALINVGLQKEITKDIFKKLTT